MLLSGKYIKLSLYALAATFLLSGCYTQLQFSEPERSAQQSYYSKYGEQNSSATADNVKERPRVGLEANRALDDTSYAMGYVDGWKESSYHFTDYATRNYWDSFYSWNRYSRFNMYDPYHSRFAMAFHDPFFYDRYPVYQFGFSFGYSRYPHYYSSYGRYYDPYRSGFGFGSYYSGYPSYFGWSGTGVVVSDKDKIDAPRNSGVTRAAATPGLSNSGAAEVSRQKTSNWERIRQAIERRLTPRNGSGSSYDSPRSTSGSRSYEPSGSGTRRSSGTTVGRSRSSSTGSSGTTRSSSGSRSSGSRNDSPRSSGSDRSGGSDNSRGSRN